MPVVSCPGCSRQIHLSPEDLARTVECARCGFRFGPEPRVRSPQDEQLPGLDWTPSSRSRYPAWLMAAFTVIPILLIIAVVALIAFSQPGNRKVVARQETALAARKPASPEEPMPKAEPAEPIRRPQPVKVVEEKRPAFVLPKQVRPEIERPAAATPDSASVTDPSLPANRVRSPQEETGAKPTSAELAILKRINLYRQIAGVTPITIDPALSQGCAAHALYLMRNFHVRNLAVYDENPELQDFTEAGWKTAKVALIHLWRSRQPLGWPATAVDYWMATFYQRIPFLSPDLEAVGVGFLTGGQGTVGVLVVDCKSRSRSSGVVTATMFPADKQREIPCFFGMGMGEVPSPVPGKDNPAGVGFPITVTFWNAGRVENVRAVLYDSAKQKLPIWLSTPEYPSPATHLQQNTVCLIPKKPLKLGPVYTVEVSATADGMDWKRVWSFTTSGR